MQKNLIELFCGAGGISEGFKNAGFKILLGIDINPVYLSSFAVNHPNAETLCDDIRHINGSTIKKYVGEKKIYAIVGGPPCQGFSVARKRNVKDSRNNLPLEFLRIVNEIRPRWFVCENVVGILTAKLPSDILVKDRFIGKAKKIGYKTEYRILNAAYFGVPQNRRRVIFIGTRLNKKIRFPSQKGNKTNLSWKILTKKHLVPKNLFYSKKLIKGFQKREKDNRKKGLGFRWQFLKPKSPSYTIPARYWKDGSNALVKYKDGSIRMLTEEECSKIQGFPQNYTFLGNKRKRYEQIGNAVPPLLAAAIAREI
ncbi:MAG: DNA cytosine methyltransferase [Candidatus Nealsonbacteria bacterium]